jgi:nickel-dependent lactate racemase
LELQLASGKNLLNINVDEKNILHVLKPNHVAVETTGEEEVLRALQNPIGTPDIGGIFKKGEKIAIITSDITRPMPTKKVLPHLLDALEAAGIDLNDVFVVFALGAHRSHTEEEKRYLLGDACYARVRCMDADASHCVHLGTTQMGTPVDVFEPVAKADKRICLGNIEYHYFAGYSGGAKAIMPGVSTRAAIQANHSRMVEDAACAGAIEGNPVRQDIDSVVQFLSVDFIANVILDEKKEIVRAFAGHYIQAHRAGCAFLDQMYKINISQKADIVLVSPGGYPKDINLYQAQKALDNARHAVKKGGVVILVASCKEGLGEEVFERWILNAPTADSMVHEIKRNFELGGHKAAAIAMVLREADIYLVSDMDADFVRRIFLQPFATAQQAYDAAIQKMGPDAKVIVMPQGGSTLPVAEGIVCDKHM